MTGYDTHRYNMLKRVRNFGSTYAQLFPTTSTAHDAFVTVNTEIDHLEALEVVERAASDASRASRQTAARRIFQQTLRRAGATARVVAATNPQLEVRIALPLPNDDLRLLTMARQFAAGIGPYAAQFAAHGIPMPGFEEAIATFARSVDEREAGHDDRVKARAEIEASFARALHAVGTLDVSVANYFAGDPVALHLWKHSRRIKLPRRIAADPTDLAALAGTPPDAVPDADPASSASAASAPTPPAIVPAPPAIADAPPAVAPSPATPTAPPVAAPATEDAAAPPAVIVTPPSIAA